jgi:RNA methyltransferase, TrmH family
VATRLGGRAQRLAAIRALQTVKGRREQRRYAFEGATLLSEAREANLPIEELYVTQAAYEATPLVRELDRQGVACFVLEPHPAQAISDVESPSGIVAVTTMHPAQALELLRLPGPLLLLADVNDPANAGGLLRSADAFGCRGVLFGGLGVDPYHPKVVRGSMGAVFRLALAVAEPEEAVVALRSTGRRLLGLAAGGEDIYSERFPPGTVLAVGHERHGLGRWQPLCDRLLAIPMSGRAESLSAAVAGSIGLFLACGQRSGEAHSQVLSREYS